MLGANAEEDAPARLTAGDVEREIDTLEGAHPRSPARRFRALYHTFDEIHRRTADEAADELVGWALIELHRRRDLLQHAFLEHGDSVAEGEGFGLIVGDVNHRRAKLPVQARELDACLDAQLSVEI